MARTLPEHIWSTHWGNQEIPGGALGWGSWVPVGLVQLEAKSHHSVVVDVTRYLPWTGEVWDEIKLWQGCIHFSFFASQRQKLSPKFTLAKRELISPLLWKEQAYLQAGPHLTNITRIWDLSHFCLPISLNSVSFWLTPFWSGTSGY